MLKKRQESKDNFAKNLREKCFFNDEEVQEIFDIIDKIHKKIDDVQNNTDYSDYGLISSQQLETKLQQLQEEMTEEIQSKIKEIMDKKLARAKKYFNKE